jgi:hypothetical protein
MRTVLLLSFVTTFAASVVAQTPPDKSPSTPNSATKSPPAQTAPAQTAPAQGAPASTTAPKSQPAKEPAATGQTQKPAPTTGRGATAAGTRTGLAMTVTDMRGSPLDDVHVELTGPMMRAGETSGGGLLNFTGLQGGTYRLRFSGDAITALEKEIVLVAGKVNMIDVPLSPAPPPKEIEKIVQVPAAAPEPSPAKVGPAGSPQTFDLVNLIEREYERKQPRRDSLVACSGNTRSVLTQINQDVKPLLYDNAEVTLYVISGEGTLRIGNGNDNKITAGYFASIPRGTMFVATRKGSKPLVFLSVLSGEPCEEAK